MGQDKAGLIFQGQPLLHRVLAVVQPMFAQTLLSVRQPLDVAVPQVCDRHPNGGPLVGLVSTLECVTTPWAFVVGCDMPFVASDLIEQLASLRGDHQAVVPVVAEHPQPLLAFYAQSSLPQLREQLAAGNTGLTAAIRCLDVCYVQRQELLSSAAILRSFFDLDTPQDVAAAVEIQKRIT
jgi:molybdopterin-guanine dinucleotide biosynthesis protein A